MNNNNVIQKLIRPICIRHMKKDVTEQVVIPDYTDEIIWVNLADHEKKLYEAKKRLYSTDQLIQLCTHPIILDQNKKICGNEENINLNFYKFYFRNNILI